MRVLVVGSGGREHALVRKLATDAKGSGRSLELFCAPGNPGIEELATCVQIAADDVEGLLHFAKSERVEFTIVGPEAPLASGIVDRFLEAGLRIFGPNQKAAQMEASKAFARREAELADVPSPRYRVFEVFEDAFSYLHEFPGPWVIKADGLAAGKGVTVTSDIQEAEHALRSVMEDKAFGDAGNQVVIEEFIEGEEISVMAFVDAKGFYMFPAIQDHKQVGDGDKGPNTGGMGTFYPVPAASEQLLEKVRIEVFGRITKRFREAGIEYRGVLFAGLMIAKNQPYLIEFNARFGDPETQVAMELMETDLLFVLNAVLEDRVADINIQFSKAAAVCVVLTAQGYPGTYRKGDVISGIWEDLALAGNENEAARLPYVLQAGTAKNSQGQMVTHGGRVLNVVASANNLYEAREKAYEGIRQIDFLGKNYRSDIGNRHQPLL